MYDLKKIKFQRKFTSLREISLRAEINANYKNYPTIVVILFIKSGAETVYDMKKMILASESKKSYPRNLGYKRVQKAKELVEKYEEEALLNR